MTARRAAALVLAFQLGRAVGRDGWRFVVHNLTGHPALVLAPSLGERLHAASIPKDAG